MDQTVLSRLDVGRQPYFLQTTVLAGGTNGFQLELSDALNAWTAEIAESEIKKLAKKVSMEKDDFIELSKKALTQLQLGNLAFEYQVKDLEDGGKEFAWKKVMTTGTIKFQLGCITMQPVEDPTETIQNLFIFSIGHMEKLREDIRRLEMENERLSTERSNTLKRLDKCVALKEDLEQDLYSKFQIVLNDKKAKIRGLKEEVKEAKDRLQDALANSDVTHRAGPSTDGGVTPGVSDDELEEDMDISDADTDDERTKSRYAQKRGKRATATAAPPTQSADSSLLLGEEDDDQPVAINKRRRKRETHKKETGPQKPAIPRGNSGTTPGKTPSSIQRTRSGRSKQDSQETDFSDLIDNI